MRLRPFRFRSVDSQMATQDLALIDLLGLICLRLVAEKPPIH
jgi:hypothetical protein